MKIQGLLQRQKRTHFEPILNPNEPIFNGNEPAPMPLEAISNPLDSCHLTNQNKAATNKKS